MDSKVNKIAQSKGISSHLVQVLVDLEWSVLRKWIMDKRNAHMSRLLTCPKDEIDMRRGRIQCYDDIVNGIEEIRSKYNE